MLHEFFNRLVDDTPRLLRRHPSQEGNFSSRPHLSGVNPGVVVQGKVPSIKRGYRGVSDFQY